MNAETTIALASSVVAIAALLVAVGEARTNRKHNRLTVRPILRGDWQAMPGPLRVLLRNAGYGPGIVTSVYVKAGGLLITLPFPESLEAAIKKLDVELQPTGNAPLPGTALAPGEELVLLAFARTEQNSNLVQPLVESLKPLTIIVNYKSLYDEHFACSIECRMVLR